MIFTNETTNDKLIFCSSNCYFLINGLDKIYITFFVFKDILYNSYKTNTIFFLIKYFFLLLHIYTFLSLTSRYYIYRTNYITFIYLELNKDE